MSGANGVDYEDSFAAPLPERDLEALRAEAETNDPLGSSTRFANATQEEQEERLRQAAAWRESERAWLEYVSACPPEVQRIYGMELPSAWPEPEDRGTATLSALGDTEYVEDLLRPGRIAVVAAEEGSGKSFAIDDELGIRVAVAGGSFAGTWAVLQTGGVLVLSEMHPDDDYAREEMVLASLGHERSALTGRYFRLSLMTAANGKPALTVPEWREWVTEWLRERGVLLLVFDTGTGATQVDPWGKAIQEVYANLRLMLDAYPALAIVILLHLKKPNGRGERRLSDVLGEWGRWCDVVVLMENDGASLTRTKLTVRKRVRHERRIVVTKAGGLLVDPVDLDEAKGTKVPLDDVVATVAKSPAGVALPDLAKALGVSRDTAKAYVEKLAGRLDMAKKQGRTGGWYVFLASEATLPASELPNASKQARLGSGSEGDGTAKLPASELPNDPYKGIGVGRSEASKRPSAFPASDSEPPPQTVACRDYSAHQSSHRWAGEGFVCDACESTA